MSIAFFLEMAWKSALIAGAALFLVTLLRSRSPIDRAAVLRIAVTMLLLLPLIAWGLPALQIEAWSAETLPAAIAYVPPPELLTYVPAAEPAALQTTIWDDPTALFAILYAGGLLMASLRLGAGLWTLQRWTKAASPADSREWQAAFERVRTMMPSRRPVRLLVADELSSPLSWGWARPVILIDRDTLAMEEDAEAILAHEWAHVVRQDWPVLMLTRIAAAIFWFNPLVWMLEREVVQQAEEAADSFAARSVEPARYAQTLIRWAQFGTHGLPANSMAPATAALARRVRAILEGPGRRTGSDSGVKLAATASCAMFAGALAALELVPQAAVAAPAAEAPLVAAAPVAAPAAAPAPVGQAAPAARAPVRTAHVQAPRVVRPSRPAPQPVVAPVPPVVEVAPLPPHPVADAPKLIGPAPAVAIVHARAAAEAHVHHPRVQASVRRGERHAHAAAHRLVIDERQIERQVEHAVRQAARARVHSSRAMDHGARGMEEGARGMEQGARNMERTAARFRNPAERERAIARAQARGETLTHEQLIELAEGMEEGARGLREGARDMRVSAMEMRRGD